MPNSEWEAFVVENRMDVFSDNVEDVKEVFQNTRVISVNCAGSVVDTVGLVSAALDPFVPRAIAIDVDEADLPNPVVFREPLEDYKPGKYMWGRTKHCCPVTLAQRRLLLPGKEEFSANYQVLFLSFLFNMNFNLGVSVFFLQ